MCVRFDYKTDWGSPSFFSIIVLLLFAISCTKYDSFSYTIKSKSHYLDLDNTVWRYDVENPQVKKYLDEVCYSSFDNSRIKEYATEQGYRMDFPFPIRFEQSELESINHPVISLFYDRDTLFYRQRMFEDKMIFDVYNLIPNRIYTLQFNSENDSSHVVERRIMPEGRVRLIKTEKLRNIRDIGGKENDLGDTVSWGKVYRGCSLYGLSERDKETLLSALNIECEIDLRSNHELHLDDDDPTNDANFSLLGSSVTYYHNPLPLYDYIVEDQTYVSVFREVLSCLKERKSVYIHCAGGADRTGVVFILLESLLGLRTSAIATDYELTSFTKGYYDKNNYRECNRCNEVIDHFRAVGGRGRNLQEIATCYLVSLGVSLEEISEFQRLMYKDEVLVEL